MFEPGHQIKMSLYDRELTQNWLVGQLSEKGIDTCQTELSAVLAGRRQGPKARMILTISAEILREL